MKQFEIKMNDERGRFIFVVNANSRKKAFDMAIDSWDPDLLTSTNLVEVYKKI